MADLCKQCSGDRNRDRGYSQAEMMAWYERGNCVHKSPLTEEAGKRNGLFSPQQFQWLSPFL